LKPELVKIRKERFQKCEQNNGDDSNNKAATAANHEFRKASLQVRVAPI
jgi:hypothetical protein